MKSEAYTFREAMNCLGLKSKSALYRLEKRYPDAFVIMKTGTDTGYDKATLDRFAVIREYFKNGNDEHNYRKRIGT
jgi:hypothetical protein